MEECKESLIENGAPFSPALCGLLSQLLDAPEGASRLTGLERLNSRVHRLRFDAHEGPRSVVAKRLSPEVAKRNAMVLRRWLPAVGLGRMGAVLLGEAAEPADGHVWHVYEDQGEWGLAAGEPDRQRVEAAVRAIAELHLRFAGHPLLGECRLWGGDHGIHFYAASVKDALRALAALKAPSVEVAAGDCALRDRLLVRLESLRAGTPDRARLLAEWGGPETLLHGDLWPQNVFVAPGRNGFEVRLIDWDHAGVGPVSYDFSTFLYRFPARERGWILEVYRRTASERGLSLPSPETWNRLCETAELARMANRIIWPALAVLEGDGGWAWEALREVERWFEALEPVLS